MKVSPNTLTANLLKKPSESCRTLTASIHNYRTTTVQGPIKDGIKITGQDSGSARVKIIRNLSEKKISLRVTIRGINSSDPKTNITK